MTNGKITKLREYIEKTKASNYPIENKFLREETDYIKNGYLKMLAVLLQQGDEIKESQSALFARIIKGVTSEKSLEEYLRQALEIEINDFVEFTEQCKEILLKYRFVLDGILLINIDEHCEEQIELLVGFIEALKLNKNEIKYIASMAKCIFEQDSNSYQEIESIRPEYFDYKLFLDYIETFVSGILCDTEKEINISSSEKKKFELGILNPEDNKLNFTKQEVKFKNIIFDMKNIEMNFCSNELVHIENCEFIGLQFSINIKACKEVVFSNCTFRGFNVRTIIEKNIESIIFENCMFVDCYYQYFSVTYNWRILGAIIYAEEPNKTAINVITNTMFKNCGGINSSCGHASAIISNCNVNVSNCKFYNCLNYYDKTEIDPDDSRRTLFVKETENSQNEIIGSAYFS